MKRNYYILLMLFAATMMWSCGEDVDVRTPIESGSGKPQNVSEFSYESLGGAVKLSYKLPNDPNVAQVKVNYTLGTGVRRTVAASVYVDYIILDGFIDEELHDVEVYTVSKANVNSAIEVTQVKAGKAAIWKVQESLAFSNQFGGYNIDMINEDTSVVSIFIMTPNEFNEFEVNNFMSFATSFPKYTRRIRGLDTVEYEYKYFVLDKWNNSTDTVKVKVKPLYETVMPISKYASYRLPGDAPMVTNGAAVEFAWDNIVDNWPSALFTSQELGGKDPHMVTIDIGDTLRLSRFWYRPYPEFWWDASTIQFYYLTTMREFEFYGSISPNPNGKLDSTWTLMGEFEVVKPSGSPYGADTPEDVAVAKAGLDFEFDATFPKIRYVRIRCLRNWADGTAMNINECRFYGDPRKND
jgi:hypothetical protein